MAAADRRSRIIGASVITEPQSDWLSVDLLRVRILHPFAIRDEASKPVVAMDQAIAYRHMDSVQLWRGDGLCGKPITGHICWHAQHFELRR